MSPRGDGDVGNVLERKLNALLERLETPKIDPKLLAMIVGKDATLPVQLRVTTIADAIAPQLHPEKAAAKL